MRSLGASRSQNATRTQVSRTRSIPAPVGGWDAKNALADMPPENAVILDNWIPKSSSVDIRRGFAEQVTGTPSPVETLLAWRGAVTGVDKLFACAGTAIYNVSTQGVSLGAAVVSGLTNVRFQYINFANDGGAFIIAVNGDDTPIKYDGTTWGTTAITGSSGSITLDPKTLVDVMNHKRRLLFIEDGTLRVWFLGLEAIAGAAQLLDLGPVFQKGGGLTCMQSWSFSPYGLSIDDYAVFITDQGEVAVYQGQDPSDATNWALVGVYSIGLPIGRRSALKFGGDLVVLTDQGVLPLSQSLKRDRSEDEQLSVTDMIRNAFADASRSYRSNFGWQGMIYPKGALAIFNVPVSPLVSSIQYVQNLQTGKWCSFSGINAFCWEVANDKPYFGGIDGVYEWDIGATDNGATITYDLKGAFSDFGQRASLKKFTMLRPILQSTNFVQPALEMLTDYRESVPTAVPTVVNAPTTAWGAGIFGTSPWSNPNTIRYDWTSVTGLGYVGAPRLRAAVTSTFSSLLSVNGTDTIITGGGDDVVTEGTPTFDVTVQLIGFDVVFQPGGVL